MYGIYLLIQGSKTNHLAAHLTLMQYNHGVTGSANMRQVSRWPCALLNLDIPAWSMLSKVLVVYPAHLWASKYLLSMDNQDLVSLCCTLSPVTSILCNLQPCAHSVWVYDIQSFMRVVPAILHFAFAVFSLPLP